MADKDIMKKIWDNFYVPFVKGYFTAYGKFRSDDVKIGEILAFTGSSTASMYFPDEVEQEDEVYPIDYVVLPAPPLRRERTILYSREQEWLSLREQRRRSMPQCCS
mgnify:CR=1 FL=1